MTQGAVSQALKQLRQSGLITVDSAGRLTLLIDESSEVFSPTIEEIETTISYIDDLNDVERKYVLKIEALHKKLSSVRAIDLAHELGLTQGAVSQALKKLKDRGLIWMGSDRAIHLVEQPQIELTTETKSKEQLHYYNADGNAQREDEEQALREVEEKARREAEAQAYREDEYKAHREAEEKARREFEEQARREAKEKARREAEEQARREAEEIARREAEEKARREAEEQARREAEEIARREAEDKARREAEEKARREAEEQARREAEERAHREAEEKSRHEAEEQERRATEQRAKQEAEKKARQDAEETKRRAIEAQRIAEKARISAEILDLTNEMNSLKGLFAGMKRKKLQAHINELNEQLRRL